MADYEIIGAAEPRGGDGVSEPTGRGPGGPSPWLIAVPLLLVALVAVALARGGSDPSDEAATPDTASPEILDRAEDPEGGGTSDPGETYAEDTERLLASFDHLVRLIGGPDEPVRAVRLDGDTEVELPLTGYPVAYSDPWLVLHQSDAIVVADLSAADPAPVTLIPLSETPDEVVAGVVDGSLLVAAVTYDESGGPPTGQAFELGSWAPLGEVSWASFWRGSRPGPTSISGSGVFDGTDEKVSVANGSLLGANRERAVVRQCEGFTGCEIVVYDRDGWGAVSHFDNSLVPPGSSVELAPDALVGLIPGYSGLSWILDLDGGTRVELAGTIDGIGYQAPLAVSSEALLLTNYGESLVVVDRATGETYRIGGSAYAEGETYYGGFVIVERDLPPLAASRAGSNGTDDSETGRGTDSDE